jgi:GT2 family glycosyltransferase
MLIRGDLVRSLGGLDPEYYPAYVEEADLCYRAKKMGYRSVVCFASRVRHIGDKSSGNASNSFRRYMANRFLFGLKHLGAVQFLLAGAGLVLKVAIRKLFPHKKRI